MRRPWLRLPWGFGLYLAFRERGFFGITPGDSKYVDRTRLEWRDDEGWIWAIYRS